MLISSWKWPISLSNVRIILAEYFQLLPWIQFIWRNSPEFQSCQLLLVIWEEKVNYLLNFSTSLSKIWYYSYAHITDWGMPWDNESESTFKTVNFFINGSYHYCCLLIIWLRYAYNFSFDSGLLGFFFIILE